MTGLVDEDRHRKAQATAASPAVADKSNDSNGPHLADSRDVTRYTPIQAIQGKVSHTGPYVNPMRRLLALLVPVALLLLLPTAALADDGGSAARPADIKAAVHEYYAAEVKTSFLFVGYGAVTGAAGGVALGEGGDFAQGFGWTSVALGGATALGGAVYGIAAKLRGDYYEDLAARDPAKFKSEESERIRGTNDRFWLYLGTELLETAAGIGIAAYGVATNDDLLRGVGAGAALQGIGLFVIDVPGAGRAARYQDRVKGIEPAVSFDGRSWMATARHTF